MEVMFPVFPERKLLVVKKVRVVSITADRVLFEDI
jgi:hypothetical protein